MKLLKFTQKSLMLENNIGDVYFIDFEKKNNKIVIYNISTEKTLKEL